MIFSENWFKMSPLSVGGLVAVYQGTQPTLADYIENYESSYNFDSPDILQIILTGGTLQSNGTIKRIETNPENLGYTQGLYSIREGIGTWAAIFPTSPASNSLEGYYELTNAQEYMTMFLSNGAFQSAMIVPISDLSDNGVIKFNSTSFSHPDQDQEDRVLDLSITISP